MNSTENRTEYLPLGSVVRLKGGVKKLMIIARGLAVKLDGEEKFFDYGGGQYPEGLSGDEIAYFNHDGILKTVFEGYSDEDDKIMVEAINEFRDKRGLEKGDPYQMNKEKGRV